MSYKYYFELHFTHDKVDKINLIKVSQLISNRTGILIQILHLMLKIVFSITSHTDEVYIPTHNFSVYLIPGRTGSTSS